MIRPQTAHSQSEKATTIASSTIKTAKNRRALLDEKLKNHKQDKLKRKLPVDSQLLTCAQEEFQIKKQLLDKLDTMDQQYTNSMKSLSSNIEKLTNCITDVFSVFKYTMMPQPQMSPMGPQYHQQPMGPQYHQQPMGYQPLPRQEYSNSPSIDAPSQSIQSFSQQLSYLDSDHGQY